MPFRVLLEEKQSGPVAAIGPHAELLGDLEESARVLIELIACERSGVYDGLGQRFWAGSDLVLNTAKRLVSLAEQRTVEFRDASR